MYMCSPDAVSCSVVGDSNAELCARWMQLGAFYPFSRNHNNKGATSQEPYAFDEQVTDISRHVLNARYSLLPYYYTLFHYASRPISSTNSPAATVTRPLFFEFPDDPNTYDIDRQFMVGNGLLISPVLTEGKCLELTNNNNKYQCTQLVHYYS